MFSSQGGPLISYRKTRIRFLTKIEESFWRGPNEPEREKWRSVVREAAGGVSRNVLHSAERVELFTMLTSITLQAPACLVSSSEHLCLVNNASRLVLSGTD